MNRWASDAFFYHIYPLGLCAAPENNGPDVAVQHRIEILHGWIPHIRGLGANAVYLGPVFESCRHGYDTTDYCTVDKRLGTNESLRRLVESFHENGIRVVLDGVFNHVGREFLAFKDLKAARERSAGTRWFRSVNFGNNNVYNDGFSYSSWAGCQDLVELNLKNQEVVSYLLDCVRRWIEEFDIDGIRLDAADRLDIGFLQQLRRQVASLKNDFWLMGEVLHSGEYGMRMDAGKLDSVTNYEVYKGLYSSHNDRNYFEIACSLHRQFGDNGVLRGSSLYNFADNHDVSRIMSVLKQKEHVYPLHILLFTIPGVPSVYYGSEWGIQGSKAEGDKALRPCLDLGRMKATALTAFIARLAMIRRELRSLKSGAYRQLHVSGEVFAFMRQVDGERTVVAVNLSRDQKTIEFKVQGAEGSELHDVLDDGKGYRVSAGAIRIAVKGNYGAILHGRS